MMDRSFIEKIVELGGVEQVVVGGREYTTKELHPVHQPTAKTVGAHTLSGLVDFVRASEASLWPGAVFHVEDYKQASLISGLNEPWRQRETYITATAHDLRHKFADYMPVEEFVVYLQSMFVQDETTARVMRIVGNLTIGREVNVADDGMTQRVTAKAGVTRVEVVDLPNPIALRPFRTFMDIEQPASRFILRIKGGAEDGPRCALFEADGGAWKIVAINSIREYLATALPDVPVVA